MDSVYYNSTNYSHIFGYATLNSTGSPLIAIPRTINYKVDISVWP